MTRKAATLEARALATMFRKGWIAFVLVLFLGAATTAVTTRSVAPQPYKPTIRITLPGGDAPKDRSIYDAIPPECIERLGLKNSIAVMPVSEQARYGKVVERHQRGELAVQRYNISDRGILNFRVNIRLSDASDPRLNELLATLNNERIALVDTYKKRAEEVEHRLDIVALGLQRLSETDGSESSELISYLAEQQRCLISERNVLNLRLGHSYKPIILDKFADEPPSPSKMKTLIVSMAATLIAAIFCAILTGFALLFRSEKR